MTSTELNAALSEIRKHGVASSRAIALRHAQRLTDREFVVISAWDYVSRIGLSCCTIDFRPPRSAAIVGYDRRDKVVISITRNKPESASGYIEYDDVTPSIYVTGASLSADDAHERHEFSPLISVLEFVRERVGVIVPGVSRIWEREFESVSRGLRVDGSHLRRLAQNRALVLDALSLRAGPEV